MKALLLVLLYATILFPQSIKVSWSPNSEDDLSGYSVYIGESTGNYNTAIKLTILEYENPGEFSQAPTFTWKNLDYGVKYFLAVTAFDFAGNESGFSEEVNITIPDAPDTTPPGNPSGVEVEVTIKVKVKN